MSVADGVLVQFKEISQLAETEVALHILLVVDDARAECLLVRLPLEDLLLYRSRLQDQHTTFPAGFVSHFQTVNAFSYSGGHRGKPWVWAL